MCVCEREREREREEGEGFLPGVFEIFIMCLPHKLK